MIESTTTLARPVNGYRAKETLIGRVHKKDTVEHRVLYETASWYTLVDVPAGSYDVILHEGMGITWVLVRYVGLITKEHFVNRVFTSSSVHEPTENIGKERSCTAQLNGYIAAHQFATNPEWELAEGWRIEMCSRAPHREGELPYKSYSLKKEEA